MLDAAEQLRASGATVVFLNAELELPTLSREIEEVLETRAEPGHPATRPPCLPFIDGIDRLRLGPEVRRMRNLIARLTETPWRVAIASRSYDLEHSPHLAALFPPLAVPPEYVDPRFTALGQLQLGELGHNGLAWFRTQSAPLDELLRRHRPS
jgi:hypothetical protein